MGTGCGFPKQDPPPPRLSRDATQLHNTPYNDSCKKLSRFGLRPHLPSTTSPPARVNRAHRFVGSIPFLKNRTDPSAIAAWKPSA